MSPGAALYSETSGHGAPLVLLHGWAMNLRVFDALRARLAPHYAVTVIDLPGHGRSPWPSDWSAARQLALIAEAVPPGATLIGWSLGGQLALQIAAEGARTLTGLILIATTPRFVRGEHWPYALAPATLQQFARALEHHGAQVISDFLDLQVRGSSDATSVRTTLRSALANQGFAQPQALTAGLSLLEHNDLRACARAVAIPTLVIAGQYDRIVPPEAAQALAALLPRARLQLVRRSGHAPFLSHLEQVATALLQFLGSSSDTAAALAP